MLALLLLPAAAFSVASEPRFTPGQVQLPPLSLREAAKAALPSTQPDAAPRLSRSEPRRPLPKPRMRTIEPRTNPDPHMAFPPNPAIDYKLRILRPSEMAPGR